MKKLELKVVTGAKKSYAHMRGAQTQGPAPAPPLPERDFSEVTKEWPNRAVVPPVKDVIALRQTLPPHVTPTKVGELAATRFGWDRNQNTVTSEQYIRGVAAAHDQTKRTMLDELAKLIQDKATSPEDAFRKMQWVQEWIKMQNRSPTPKQLFDD